MSIHVSRVELVRKVVSLMLIATFVWVPSALSMGAAVTQGKSGKNELACEEAIARARVDVSEDNWFVVGCVGGLTGLILANALEAEPPADVLVGKPLDYVSTYTLCYAEEARKIRKRGAMAGCLIAVAAYFALGLIVVSSASSNSSAY